MKKPRLVGAALATLYFFNYLRTSTEWHFIDNANLIIHEAGHTFLFLMPSLITALGGSLFQVLIPALFIGYFIFRKDYFSSSILGFWLGQNLVNISIYARDSIVMQLPLLGGDNVNHDWNFILSTLHLLKYTYIIANIMNIVGVLIIMIACYFSFYFALHNTMERPRQKF
jgi:hypothetical protein